MNESNEKINNERYLKLPTLDIYSHIRLNINTLWNAWTIQYTWFYANGSDT